MRKIIGDTTAAPNPRPNWAQTDANKADYIKNKPTLGEMAKKDKVAKEDLSAEVQERLDSMSTASEIKAVSYEPQTLTDGQKAQARLNIGAAELDANGKVPLEQLPPYADKVTKEDVGLGNVDNIKQYSAENPPPYPVTSVNGQTGSVVIDINTSIPEALPNPFALTIDGTSYDGSKAVSVFTGAGKSVLAYGAKGDGSIDDTAAFKSALTENRIVFVPGGTYKLTSGITIGDNCCLELAQDAVLNFTNTTGNCITLGMLSNLKGNHATIKVPYEFEGNVLYAYSNDHLNAEINAVPPFTKWDPQWKSGRYVTDVNICKADSRGFHYAVNPDECRGVAVYLSADNTQGLLGFMWGIHFSGLRIAGAFAYGIHCKNIDRGWMHELRIDAFIDACEIGVQLEDCNNAYISAIVQPRRAYTADEVYKPYAKHGIKLVNSENVDLSGSRVWDWENEDKANTAENEKMTLWSDGGEYQSYAMFGDCRGAIINDFRYHDAGYDIRKHIYTDSDINLDTMSVLQEPITKYFKVLNDEPYYSDGLFEHKLITQEHLDKHFDTGVVKNFNDLLPTAIDTDGSIYNGIGYKKNTYIQSNGVTKEAGYYVATGFIPCTAGSVIYAHDMSFSKGDDNCRIIFYDKNFNVCTYGNGNTTPLLVNRGLLLKNGNTYVAEYTELADGFKIILNGGQYGPHGNTAYARLSIYKAVWGENPMISVDEQIAYTVEGFLADGVKVKGENVIGEIGVGQPDWVAKKKMVGGTEIFIPEQSVSSMSWNNLQIALQSGVMYDVYVDGVLYACEAWGSGQSVYLGNNTSLTRNDYPFCVFWAGGTATSGMFFGEGKKLKVTDHAYYVYDKMPTEYLPDCVVKSVNGKTPDENGNVTVSGAGGGVDPEELTAAVESALEEAKASGMFDGKDGVTITRILNEVNEVTGVETNIVYFSDGQVVRITNGEPGADGVSVGIRDVMHNETTGQHIVTFTDGTQLTVNDGTDGKDGTSVTVKSVSESTADGGSNVVAFSDGKTLTVRNGTKGSTGKTAYEYAQDGGYLGTEVEFAKELAKTPLVGTSYGASIVKPSQVAKAVAEGRPVEITEGDVIFRDFYIQDNTVTSTILNWSSTGYQPQTIRGILDTDKWYLHNAVKLVDKTQIPTELKNPNKLTINGEDYDGSEAVSMNLSKAPLVGSFLDITPSQVAEAVAESRPVEVTNVDEIYRNFYISDNEVIGSLLDWSNVRLKVIKGAIDTNKWFFSNTGELASTTQIPTELKNPNRLTINGTAYDGSTEVNMELAKPSDIPTIPTALKNPNALTFTGGASGTYDGSEAKTINIPTVPTALKNPNKLTINGTEYDGSKEVSVSVAKEPLVGALANYAPEQVAEAIAEGRTISLTHPINGVEHTFNSFDVRDGKILGEIIFQAGDDSREISVAYIEGSFSSDGTSYWRPCVTGQLARMDDIPTIPTALKNPSKLIINGEEYDGSKQIIMNLAKPSDIPSALKNPNALTINGTEYDGSSAVNIKLAKEPLIGSANEITPLMVADAVREGRSVVLRSEAFKDSFTSFDILNDKYVVGGVVNTGNINGVQLICAYGNIETGAWTFVPRNLAETEDIPSVPSALKNPNALAFTGAVTESYDGSEAKTVNIPTVPSALKNPNTLTINGIAYDGSSAVSMELAKLSDIPEVEWMATVPEISGGSVVMETNLNFTSKYHTLNPHWKPVVGYNYDIYWNDDKYTCAIVESSGEAFVGNRSLMSSSYPDTGEPFLFTGWALTNPELTSVQKATATEEEVSLRIETERIVKCDKLPEVYLPDCVVKSVNGNTPDGVGNIKIAALKNPNALTINGEAYDGSKAVEIELAKKSDIPTVPTALKNPNALTINGTSYDGSSAVSVNIKEGLEPLIGSTAEITPIMVVGAIAEGRSVMLAHTTEDFGRLAFNHFTYAVDIGDVVSSGVVYYQGVYVIVELVGSVSGGSWSVVGTVVAQLSDIPTVPTTLPNPEFLIINGQTYDGEDPLVVDTFVHAVFTYHEESSIGVGGMRVTCDITPSNLVNSMANKTVIAELKDEGGAYIGSAVFGKKDLLSAVADIVTAVGIYRITAVSGNAGYSVAYTAISSGNGGGIVIFEEKAVSGYFVNNLSFELDAEYDIYWNDKKYVCTSYKSEGEVYTGNGHIINTNLPDTGEPFLFTHMAGASAAMLHKASGQASSNTLMVATHGYNAGGGGTSIDVTAEVGQTIVVEEVDGSGKPTKWRAAEYQPRTHWSEYTELLPLTEVTPQIEESLGVAMSVLPICKLTKGNQYKVAFDGMEYICQATFASSMGMNAIIIGNLAMAGGEDTGEPFVYAYMLPDDNPNDGTTIYHGNFLFTMDTNPHTVQVFEEIVQKIPTKFVPTFEEMTEENVVVLPETTLSENIDGFLIIPADLGLKANQEYTVNYNGVEYVVSNGIAEDDMFRIGNLGVLDVNQPNTGEPFIIAYGSIQHPDGSTTYGWGLAPLDGSASVTLSIKGKRTTSVFSQYLSNAFPYYIDVNCEMFSNAQTPPVYTCRETVANVTDIFASGREIKVRFTTTGHNATPIVGIYSMYMYAIASEGVFFGFMAGNGYSSVSNLFLHAQAGDNTFTISDSMD